MSPAATEPAFPESSSVTSSPARSLLERPVGEDRRFGDRRGVKWRIDLGILSSSSSIDDLRRVTADTRRRYAALRRRLLVDPHISKDGSKSPDLVMDNPLSQNPDSMWSRFFRNAELERMVDQDLSRLYPEHGSYFQTSECQGILRRILLLWCLQHPEYGYRQGMHELLAPLLYVLHVDVEHLLEVRKLYEDHFSDKFDGFSFHESDLTHHHGSKKSFDSIEDEIESHRSRTKFTSLDELDPKVQAIILLSDAYGAEGELGIVLSEKFMEHDAYNMFDALMSRAGGSVAMAEFFSLSALGGPHAPLPPVIEASSAIYHLLSLVDSSLHSHLIELGVEPQYFALRWLRVLFGREFALEDLLIIWDEILACDNSKTSNNAEGDTGSIFRILNSRRGAFISSIAVSMILYLRSSLLATEHATSALQRLLNFPAEVNLEKLIRKAKSLQALALNASTSLPQPGSGGYGYLKVVRDQNVPSDSISPASPFSLVPESYWEEKWRVLHDSEELKEGSSGKQISKRKKGWSLKMRLSLSSTETESAPLTSEVDNRNEDPVLSVRRSLMEDLCQHLVAEEDAQTMVCNEGQPQNQLSAEEFFKHLGTEGNVKTIVRNKGLHQHRLSNGVVEVTGEDRDDQNFTFTAEEKCVSEGNSSTFSDPPSSFIGASNCKHESERSSVASNLSLDEKGFEANIAESFKANPEKSPVLDSVSSEDATLRCGHSDDSVGKTGTGWKERKLLLGKLQWLRKFRRSSGEGNEATKSYNGANDQNHSVTSSTGGVHCSSDKSKGEAAGQNELALANLGQSILENIEVIESFLQQDQSQVGSSESLLSKNVTMGERQDAAMAALKELRKISSVLSEM